MTYCKYWLCCAYTLHHSLLPFIIHYYPFSFTTAFHHSLLPFIIQYNSSYPNVILFLNAQDELFELSPIPNTFGVSKKCTKMEPLTKTQTCYSPYMDEFFTGNAWIFVLVCAMSVVLMASYGNHVCIHTTALLHWSWECSDDAPVAIIQNAHYKSNCMLSWM